MGAFQQIFAAVLFSILANQSVAMIESSPMEQLGELRNQLLSVGELVALAQKPYSDEVKERVKNLWLSDRLREIYATNKFTIQKFQALMIGLPLAKKFNSFPNNSDALMRVDEELGVHLPALMKEGTAFVEEFEFVVGEIARLRSKVLGLDCIFGKDQGELFTKTMLHGMTIGDESL